MGVEELNLLNVCLDAKLELPKDLKKGDERVVCKGIEELASKRKMEGRYEGEEHFNHLINVLAANGYQLKEILSMTSNSEQRAELYEKYGVV